MNDTARRMPLPLNNLQRKVVGMHVLPRWTCIGREGGVRDNKDASLHWLASIQV